MCLLCVDLISICPRYEMIKPSVRGHACSPQEIQYVLKPGEQPTLEHLTTVTRFFMHVFSEETIISIIVGYNYVVFCVKSCKTYLHLAV